MTIDLSTARAGCEVTFRCGGKALVTAVINAGDWLRLGFGDSPNIDFPVTGRYSKLYEHPFDIVSITDPPLTEAERLAEIARLMNAWCSKTVAGLCEGVAVPPERWIEILALAEGRAP